MTTEMHSRKKIVSLWLPIAVLSLGLIFLSFIFIEFQRNTALIEQNRRLISSSAKTRLVNNISDRGTSRNWESIKGEYKWIQHAPHSYWFDQGKQIFPWNKTENQNTSIEQQHWGKIWSELNSALSKEQGNLTLDHIDTQRSLLLNNLKSTLESNDEASIKQSFNAYLEHQNVYHLAPKEEIAFSLKLIEIGAEKHWSPELIHAILITGGSADSPILRPVVDLLFRHVNQFSNNDIKLISGKIKQQLETFNLSNYFFDDYLQLLDKPKFSLPANITTDIDELNNITDNGWFIQGSPHLLISASPIKLNEELKLIENEFIQLGVLNKNDSLLHSNFTGHIPLDSIVIEVNKLQLTNDQHNQLIYLIIKSIMLIMFVALILLTLRLMEKDQQRRFEYLALKEDFIKLVSHELKTPLAGIRAMAETLQKRIDRNLSTEAYPKRIISEADKLWYMVDNILGFNRVQLNNTTIEKQPTPLKQLCDNVIGDVRSLSNKLYSIDNTINELIEVTVDVELFSLVIKNIVVNAGLYNNHEIIEIKLSFDKNAYNLLISDNGIGINESDKNKIFEPFVRLEQSTRHSGTGLGLAMCKRVMQLHSGDLSLAQSSNQGSVWKISFKQPAS